MNTQDFSNQVSSLLQRTLKEGPGPRAAALTVADKLAVYVMNEAGGMAPDAVEEIVLRLRGHIAAATATMNERAETAG